VTATAPFVAIRGSAASALPQQTITVASIPPALVIRGEAQSADAPARRTKIWEFNTNLHCSIIGTCLSTAELRQLLKKLGLAPPGSTDHELHGAAVILAARHDKAAKLLNKALDERHRLAIRQFEKANTEDDVRALWADAVGRGEIPGAYWATLTHPAATHAVIREAFGEVHMLSHLVGAANRADIRRLCRLEADNAALQARLDRQQIALHQAVVTRDACIGNLRQALAQHIAAQQPIAGDDSATLRQLVADMERRLAGERQRNAALEERLAAAKSVVAEERSARTKAERACSALRSELDLIETSLLPSCDDNSLAIASAPQLEGVTVLYVGGRPNQVAHLREATERSGAAFLHHDGGIEHQLNLLAGLSSRADIVVVPVDCISHHAAQAAKQLCRQTDKRFIPLRSSSVTSLLVALQRVEMPEQAAAAD
jgi:hypothetical protein